MTPSAEPMALATPIPAVATTPEGAVDAGAAPATRAITFAWRLLQQVRKTRLAAENRLRSANSCLYCSGKRRPKRDHVCLACTPDRCAHCDGTGEADITLPEELLAQFGIDLEALRTAESNLERHLLRLARSHPDWPALQEVAARWPGVGEVTMAALLGLAGDLRAYRTPRRLMRYLGIGVGEDGRALCRKRGIRATYRPEGQAWCFLVMQQWLRYGRRPAAWEARYAYEQAKEPRRAATRTARWLVQQLLRDCWVAINAAPTPANASMASRANATAGGRVAGVGAASHSQEGAR